MSTIAALSSCAICPETDWHCRHGNCDIRQECTRNLMAAAPQLQLFPSAWLGRRCSRQRQRQIRFPGPWRCRRRNRGPSRVSTNDCKRNPREKDPRGDVGSCPPVFWRASRTSHGAMDAKVLPGDCLTAALAVVTSGNMLVISGSKLRRIRHMVSFPGERWGSLALGHGRRKEFGS